MVPLVKNCLVYIFKLTKIQINQNITAAINNMRAILGTVANSLRNDTQCGFAGAFYASFSAEFCKTGKYD